MKTGSLVIVALSGGVDSAMTALILKKKHTVQGIFFKMHDRANENKVQKMAEKLKIPLKIMDVRKEFQERVIDSFLREYQNNKTPNPCIICNKDLKFHFLLEELKKNKADFVATGHYARIRRKISDSKLSQLNGRAKLAIQQDKQIPKYRLLRGRDKQKDQSYFLYRLTQKDLKKIIFPLGEMNKSEILEMAKQNNLIDDNYQESQEVCFIENSVEDYLRKNLGQKKGEIIDIGGKVLGEHQGLHFYTIGQRRGIGFSGGPFFVIKKEPKENLLIVSKEKKDLISKNFEVKNLNWINKVIFPLKTKAKFRSKSGLYDVIVKKEGNKYFVELKEYEIGVTPGQSVVFYNRDEVLGGGIID